MVKDLIERTVPGAGQMDAAGLPASAGPRDLSERYARTVAAQDAVALGALLATHVRFRALTPGRCWEADDADAAVEVVLGTWFPPERAITEILGIECGSVGTVDHVAYRFRVAHPDDTFVIEQQAYLDTEDGTISRLQILCSGFVRET